jgi:hypothetical protein
MSLVLRSNLETRLQPVPVAATEPIESPLGSFPPVSFGASTTHQSARPISM